MGPGSSALRTTAASSSVAVGALPRVRPTAALAEPSAVLLRSAAPLGTACTTAIPTAGAVTAIQSAASAVCRAPVCTRLHGAQLPDKSPVNQRVWITALCGGSAHWAGAAPHRRDWTEGRGGNLVDECAAGGELCGVSRSWPCTLALCAHSFAGVVQKG